MIKRLFTILMFASLLSLSALALPAQSSAVNIFKNTCDAYQGAPSVCQDVEQKQGSSSNPIVRIIKAAISVLSYIVGIAAIVGILVSGIRLMTAGDSNSVASARTGLIYSLIGIAVVALAQAIVVFVLDKVS